MHIQQPSLSPDCTPYEGRHLAPKSNPSIWSGACQAAVQALSNHTSVLITLSPTAPLPASFLTTPDLSIAKLLASLCLGQPHCLGKSSHQGQTCPSLISHVLALWPPSSQSPPMCCVSPSHCSPMALLETDATTPWQLRVKDAAMICQI